MERNVDVSGPEFFGGSRTRRQIIKDAVVIGGASLALELIHQTCARAESMPSEPIRVTEFGTKVYEASTHAELNGLFRSWDEEISVNVDEETEEAIRVKRDIALEGQENLQDKRTVVVITDQVWQRIVDEGGGTLGTSDPVEWLEATMMHVPTEMLKRAGFDREHKTLAVIKVPDEVAQVDYVYPFRSENPALGQQNDWRNFKMTESGELPEGQLTQHPGTDILLMCYSGHTTPWPLWARCWVDVNGKWIKVEGTEIHERPMHVGEGVGDLYWETGETKVDLLYPDWKLKVVLAHCDDIMGDVNMLHIGRQQAPFIAAMENHPARENWRSTLSDKHRFVEWPHNAEYVANPHLVFCGKYHASFVSPNGTNYYDEVDSRGAVFQSMWQIPLPFDTRYGDSETPLGMFLIDAGAFPDEFADPDTYQLHCRHVTYKIGGYEIPIPRTILNVEGLSEDTYNNPNRIPHLEIVLKQNPDSFEMPEDIWIQVFKGDVPPDNDDIVAYCSLPGATHDGEGSCLVWTKNFIPVEQALNVERPFEVYLPLEMKNYQPESDSASKQQDVERKTDDEEVVGNTSSCEEARKQRILEFVQAQVPPEWEPRRGVVLKTSFE